jgi:hypothetical protein
MLTKMYSDKAESFAKFLALVERFIVVDEYNYCYFSYHPNTCNFQAAFFAPRGIQCAGRWIRKFIGINGTYIGLKF